MRYIFKPDEEVHAQHGDHWMLTGMTGKVLEGPLCGDDVYWVKLDTGLKIKIHGRDLRENR